MKRLFVFLLAILVLHGGWSVSPARAETKFTDMGEDHWAFKYIADLSKKRILSGYGDGSIQPNKTITRAEFAAILVRMLRLPLQQATSSSFTDVDTNAWYSPQIEAIESYIKGSMRPDSKGAFHPDAPATREDVAVALAHVLEYQVAEGDPAAVSRFKDFHEFSEETVDYIAIAVTNGFIAGYPDQTFRPKVPITRAEVAVVIYRAFAFDETGNYSVQGIRIGDRKEKVLSVLGKPSEEYTNEIGTELVYRQATYSLSSNKVVFIEIDNPFYMTPNGIGRRSTLKEVISVYGEERLKQNNELPNGFVYSHIDKDTIIIFDFSGDEALEEDHTIGGIMIAHVPSINVILEGSFQESKSAPLVYKQKQDPSAPPVPSDNKLSMGQATDLAIDHFTKRYKKEHGEVITQTADLNGDGRAEIIVTIESDFDEGAAAVYESTTGQFLDTVESPSWLGVTVSVIRNPSYGELLSILAEPKDSGIELYALQDSKLVLVYSLEASRIYMKDSDRDGYEEVYLKSINWDKSSDRASAYYNYYVAKWDGGQYIETVHPVHAFANGWKETEFGNVDYIAFYDDFSTGELYSYTEGKPQFLKFVVTDLSQDEMTIRVDFHGVPVIKTYKLTDQETIVLTDGYGREFTLRRTLSME